MHHRRPTYLRVEVTTSCPLRCTFCHAEGNGAAAPARALDKGQLVAGVLAAARAGVRKIKFLGGEPLVRVDLPEIVGAVRRAVPDADLSMITSGVGPTTRLQALFDAGLDRANLSIHGHGLDAFKERGGSLAKLALRDANLRLLVALGRPLKLNYVYRGTHDDADLAGLLAWASDQSVVVGVLDELGDPNTGPATIVAALRRLRGDDYDVVAVPDLMSLPTTELRWRDGLRVEVKTSQLGVVAPWRACVDCPARQRCREGIFAIRLTPDGWLQPCMDRPDWRVPLHTWLVDGDAAAAHRITTFIEESIA